MGRKARFQAYIVKLARVPGIYRTYDECKQQTDGYSNNKHQGYHTLKEAEDAWEKYLRQSNGSSVGGSAMRAGPLLPRQQNNQSEQATQFTL